MDDFNIDYIIIKIKPKKSSSPKTEKKNST